MHLLIYLSQKPYRCEVLGCTKRYTDPSSLRKHVKSHTAEEQLQYRRFKDQANAAKRSSSPFSPSSISTAVQPPRPPPTPSEASAQHWTAAARQQAAPTPTNSHFSSSSVTMLAVGLQSGGTCVLEDAAASLSPAATAGPLSSPIERTQQHHHQPLEKKNSAGARGECTN